MTAPVTDALEWRVVAILEKKGGTRGAARLDALVERWLEIFTKHGEPAARAWLERTATAPEKVQIRARMRQG